jgi:hypothetical protein
MHARDILRNTPGLSKQRDRSRAVWYICCYKEYLYAIRITDVGSVVIAKAKYSHWIDAMNSHEVNDWSLIQFEEFLDIAPNETKEHLLFHLDLFT